MNSLYRPLLLVALCWLFLPAATNAQKQANHWYFGNGAGIDFSSGTARANHDGALFTSEGCSSISDENGQLLFYTDGITVWNREHQPMVGGQGLRGHASATQSALIARKPGSDTYYYIFTVGEKADERGLSYSVVDMAAGGRLGKVIRSNTPLLRSTTEKLTVVPHSNGEDYWVLAHQWNSNGIFAYHVNSKGVQKPVLSREGPIHNDAGSGNNGEAIGQMAASADGTRLAMVQTYKSSRNLQLLDFDAKTGKASKADVYTIPQYAYGVAFSPDGTKLYVSFLQGKSGISQYDLKSTNLVGSAVRIALARDMGYGSFAYGPDGRLYAAKVDDHLDAISKPNAAGLACGYLPAVIKFNRRYSAYGLPNALWVVGPQKPAPAPIAQAKPSPPANRPGPNVASLTPTPERVAKPAAKLAVNLGADTNLCAKNYELSAGIGDATYKWSNGATSQSIKAFSSGYYAVTVTKNGQQVSDGINLSFDGKPVEFNYLPTFRPGSKVNNSFDFTLRNATDFRLRIWNQKDKLVYESTRLGQRWKGRNDKGKELPSGTYKWEFTFSPECPATGPETRTGTVKMIRHVEKH